MIREIREKPLTPSQSARLSLITSQLVRMSRDWSSYQPEDYRPLEAEYYALIKLKRRVRP